MHFECVCLPLQEFAHYTLPTKETTINELFLFILKQLASDQMTPLTGTGMQVTRTYASIIEVPMHN